MAKNPADRLRKIIAREKAAKEVRVAEEAGSRSKLSDKTPRQGPDPTGSS